jgi:hypothetical protein
MHRPRTAPVAHARTSAPAPSAAVDLLLRSDAGLRTARRADDAGERYVAAHLAALRAAAAVLAVRGRPKRGSTLNVWDVLPRVAPELAEWAVFFASGAPRRAAVEAGLAGAVSTRQADDLVREASTFADVVADLLGVLPPAAHSA